MEGIIGVENFKIECIIGDLPDERLHPQTLFIDFKIKTDISVAARNDTLSQTICYATLAEKCKNISERQQCHLLETLADAILAAFLTDSKINWAWLRIKKPGAIQGADYAYVEIERRNKQAIT